MPDATSAQAVRVRFAPSPTGYLHIGGARTVLFNWLVARQAGGAFLLRIEDTDQARHVEDSVHKILSDLRWLGLPWDEGPEVDGPCGPYFQSQRLESYNHYAQQLLISGHAYYAMESVEELQAMREAEKSRKGGFRYPRPNPLPTIEQGEAAKEAGTSVVVRLKMPDGDITVVDDILGNVTLTADQMEDFVIVKSDGFPTYHFACVVDDELMKITHVLRGQEHLMNTPKHIALQWALGFRTPRYAHLPVIFNMDGTKMSKRDKEKALAKGLRPPEIDVHDFRVAGYLPEAVLNFIALLGWSAGDDRENYTLAELMASFSIERVGKTNARFDREKLLSFNTTWATRVTPERLLSAFRDFLQVNSEPQASACATPPEPLASACAMAPLTSDVRPHPVLMQASDEILSCVLRACAGFRTFEDVIKKAGFIFLPDEAVLYDPKAVQKVLAKGDGEGFRVLDLLLPRLQSQTDWSAAAIDHLVKSICEEQGVPMGAVAQPLRVAVSGTTISPAIGDTLALLGKERTMTRIANCVRQCAALKLL